MKDNRYKMVSRSGSRRASVFARLGYTLLFGTAALALTACDGGSSGGNAGNAGTSTGGSGGSGATGGSGGSAGSGNIGKVSKVDILLSVDNSRSMADKQEILSLALDDLLSGLANPPCLNGNGQVVPAGAGGQCPAGASRQYEPVNDIHIGIVSSSLGGHGSDACSTAGTGKQSNNDKGHLLSRIDPTMAATVPTYGGFGFLAWDPLQQQSPPGENDPVALGQNFRDMVLGVGQIGCGYESQLESVYRFLVDPAPYQDIGLDAQGAIQVSGVDSTLLDQRKKFLRPDSALVILSLSDENDCSIKEEGQFYLSAQQKEGNGSAFHMPAARAECATDPNDPCCASCGQATPAGCAADPTCKVGGATKFLDELEDNINVRCFDQKRRFGIDFLYSIDRYVQGFTSATVTDRNGQAVQNPIFSDLDGSDGNTQVRDAGLVYFAGIVGVPWQSVAKNPADLKEGFKSAVEMSQADVNGKTAWDRIIGNPATGAAPLDPFMIESISPRAGVTPGNPINGGEWTIAKNDDLQYACIMPIPVAHDCSMPGLAACDCEDVNNDNPLCEAGASGDPTLQTKAKAYPGVRQLTLLKGLGEQGVVGSICAGQIDNVNTPDYAYRPVVASLLDRVKDRLQ